MLYAALTCRTNSGRYIDAQDRHWNIFQLASRPPYFPGPVIEADTEEQAATTLKLVPASNAKSGKE